ncbi:hypothetical protein NQ317_001142, partial [Molorchus minor]
VVKECPGIAKVKERHFGSFVLNPEKVKVFSPGSFAPLPKRRAYQAEILIGMWVHNGPAHNLFIHSLFDIAITENSTRKHKLGAPYFQLLVLKLRYQIKYNHLLVVFRLKHIMKLEEYLLLGLAILASTADVQSAFWLPGQIKVTRNDYQFNNAIGRSENTLENGIEEFVKSYDFRFNLPYIGSVMVDSRNLDNEEYKIKLKLSDDSVEAALVFEIRIVLKSSTETSAFTIGSTSATEVEEIDSYRSYFLEKIGT